MTDAERPSDARSTSFSAAPAWFLTLAPLVVYLGLLLGCRAAGPPWFSSVYDDWLWAVAHGANAAQAAWLAVWWAGGPLTRNRFVAFSVAVVCLPWTHLLVVGYATGYRAELWDDPTLWQELTQFFHCPLLVVGLAALAARRAGWRWRRRDEPVGPWPRVSLAAVLVALYASTLVALALRSIRDDLLKLEAAGRDGESAFSIEPWWDFLIALVATCAATAAIAADAGPRVSVARYAASLAVALALAAAASTPFAALSDWASSSDDGVAWAGTATVAWSFSAATALLARFVGWRIDRVPVIVDGEAASSKRRDEPCD